MKGFLIVWFVLTLLAKASAENSDWEKAIERYEAQLQQHGPDASVYFNLGYCHQQAGDHGRAVLAYERCLALSPRAADARHNLTKLREETSLPTVRTLADGLPLFTAWMSRGEWAFLFLLSLTMLLVSCWIAVFASKNIRRFCMILFFLSILLAIASAWVCVKRNNESSIAVIVATGQSLRLSPFANADEVVSCPAGSLCVIEQEQGDYVYARMLEGDTRGWLPKNHLERIVAQ